MHINSFAINFNEEGYKELGKRYAVKMLSLLEYTVAESQ